MRKTFLYVATTVAILVAIGCENQQPNEFSNSLSQVKFDPFIGEKHNAIVTKALTKGDINASNSYDVNFKNMISYYKAEYGYDGTELIDKIFYQKSNAARISINDFNPIEFVDHYENKYFNSKFSNALKTTLTEIEAVHQDSENMVSVISKLIEETKSNRFNLDEGSKNALLNTLTIMRSSTTLWFSELASLKSGRSQYQARRDAWKVVACDGVCGLIGGLVAGPIGALAGIAEGSTTAWITML